MPPQQPFDPIAAYRKAYANDPRSDAEIAGKLSDPANFRKAFPDYDYSAVDADSRIKAHMSSYMQKFQTPTAQPQAGVSPFWDKAVGLWYPTALAAANKVLTQPIGKTLGLQKQTLSEAYEDRVGGTAPGAQGGTTGAVQDTRRIGTQLGLGIGDFMQSPAGLASGFLTVATGGAAAPWIASGFAAGQAPVAKEAYDKYKANPTPENLQEFMVQTAMIPGMAAGEKVKDTKLVDPTVQVGRVKNIPHAFSEDALQSKPEAPYSDQGSRPGPNTVGQRQYADTIDGRQPIPTSSTKSTVRGPQSFQGSEAPMRPYDPNGTRFARGGTIGMDPITGRPKVDAVSEAGVVSKGELMPGSGVHMIEHPDAPGLTAAVRGDDINDPQAIRNVMAGRLEEFADKPTQVPGQPVQDPAKLRALASRLRGTDPISIGVDKVIQDRTPIKGPGPRITRPAVPEGMPEPAPVNPQEAADMSKKLGLNISTDQVNQVLRDQASAADIADRMQGNRADSVGEIREAHRTLLDKQAKSQAAIPVGQAQAPSLTDNRTTGMNPEQREIATVIDKTRPDDPPRMQSDMGSKPSAPAIEPVRAEAPAPAPQQSIARTRPDFPDALKTSLDRMVKLKKQVDSTVDPEQKAALNDRWQGESARSKEMLKAHLRSLDPNGLEELKGKLTDEASMHDAQSQAIREMVDQDRANRPKLEELREMTATGGPFRKFKNKETGEDMSLKPESVVGRGSRDLIHELIGEKPFTRPEQLIPNEVTAKMRKMGITEESWGEHIAKLQEKRMSMRQEIARDFEIAKDTQTSIEDSGILDKLKKLDDLERMIGRYPKDEGRDLGGRRPKEATTVGENGELIAKEALPTITLDKARTVMGAKVDRIPSHDQFLAKAAEISERGRLRKAIVSAIDKILTAKPPAGSESEAGAVGESKLKPLDQKSLDPERMAAKAKEIGMDSWNVSDDTPAGTYGWLSPNGKKWIDLQNGIEHTDFARSALSDVDYDLNQGPTNAMLKGGWIRKASTSEYQAHRLGPSQVNAIEMSLIRDGRHGKEVIIDSMGPRGIKALHVDAGWENLSTEIDREKSKPEWSPESGRIGGAIPLSSAGVGMATGAAIGAHVAGMPGAVLGGAIGWASGFATPAVLQSAVIRGAMARVSPILRSAGISAHDWFMGKTQEAPLSTDMGKVLEAQKQDLRKPSLAFTQRLAQLPGDAAYKLMDKFVFVNDRPGAIQNFLMKADPRGQAFRDLKGKLSVDDSPYVSAWLAAGGGGGNMEAHMWDYKRIIKEGQDAGLMNHVNSYLNLKGYQRVYDVLNERMQEHDMNIQNAQTKLQSPSLSVRQRVALEDDVKDFTKQKADLQNRIASGTITPAGYDPAKINRELTDMQQNLSPIKYAKVQDLSNKVFDMNSKVLDMLNQSGIVSDKDYQSYKQRGNEYIPMHRIFEQIADGTKQSYGSTSPLYLKQQNVIKSLIGSERVNRDPIVASADANLEAIKDVMRNNVIKEFVKLSVSDPMGVGKYFDPVPQGYKPGAGETTVGLYSKGAVDTYKVPSWMGETLKNVSPNAVDTVSGAIGRFASNVFKKGVTMGNLGFTFTRAIRDLTEMGMLSKAGVEVKTLPLDAAKLMRAWTRNLYDSLQKNPSSQEYMRSGAAYSTMQRNINPENFLDLTTIGFKDKIAKGRILDTVSDLNAAVEDAIKMTTFSRLRQTGMSEKAAAWETRRFGGAPDFARGGTATPAVNLAMMFFNAKLQDVARVFARAKEDPQRVLGVLGAVSMLALAANQWNQSQTDSKGNDLMRKVPTGDKERNFVILTGNTYQSSSGAELPVYYKIPKPDVVRLFYNPIENGLNKLLGNEVRTGKQLALDGLSQLAPIETQLREGEIGKSAVQGLVSSSNPAIKVPLEEAMNYKTQGEGGPIVPQREQGLERRYQFGLGTSPAAVSMGQGGTTGALTGAGVGATLGGSYGGLPGAAVGGAVGAGVGSLGISPRRLDHIQRGAAGGVGDAASSLVGSLLPSPTRGTQTLQGPEAFRNVPVAGALFGRFTASPVDAEEQRLSSTFYKNAGDLQQTTNTYNMLAKSNPQAAQQYLMQNKDNVWRGQLATSLQKRLGEVEKMQRMFQQNPNLDQPTRDNALKNIHDVKIQLLRNFNSMISSSPNNPGQTSPTGPGRP